MSAPSEPGRDPSLPSRETAPPPVGAALASAIADLRPVATRVPLRAVLVCAAVAVLVPVVIVASRGLRADFAALPRAWIIAMALTWTSGLFVTLITATWPRRGAVLPDAARAGRAAALVAAGLLALGLFATMNGPDTIMPDQGAGAFVALWWHCIRFSLVTTLPLLIAGGLALRHLFPMGSRRIAAALGAAGGAMAGLTLHFICPIGGGLHVGLAHAGGVVLGALVGMLLLPRAIRS